MLELKYLDVSNNSSLSYGSSDIYDDDLEPINKLKNLEVLKIEGLEYISGLKLGNFPNLKELNCSCCYNLEDDFLIRVLKSADKLELIDFALCTKITNAVINVAFKQIKKRKNNIVLEMRSFIPK